MHEAKRSYKGFQIILFVPDAIAAGHPGGSIHIGAPEGGIGIRFAPDWPAPPESVEQAESWLFAYAAGIVDCELAGGFGIDLRHD